MDPIIPTIHEEYAHRMEKLDLRQQKILFNINKTAFHRLSLSCVAVVYNKEISFSILTAVASVEWVHGPGHEAVRS